jgi:hypothetical protein
MAEQSPTWRKVQRRWQQSRTWFWRQRQRSGQELRLVHGAHQTGPSGVLASGQKKPSTTNVLRTAPAPRWCPPDLMSSQRKRIQWMRAQTMREEVAEKERDEHFNDIRPVILTNQEWRVKEKPTPLHP